MKNLILPLIAASFFTACAASPAAKAPASKSAGSNGVLFAQDFDGSPLGLYSGKRLAADWGKLIWHSGFDEGRARIVDAGAESGRALEITYTAGGIGPSAGASFKTDIPKRASATGLPAELYLSYDVQFAPGFDFVKGGKLPGLCGYNVDKKSREGCNTGGGFPDGYDGWSARGMWRAGGALENYVYNASQKKFYGDSERWGVSAKPGRWHAVQHRVVMNTPGQKDGILEAWMDGQKVLSLTGVEYRKTNRIGVNLFYFSTFFGGNTPSWAPATDQTIRYDNFVISTQKIADAPRP